MLQAVLASSNKEFLATPPPPERSERPGSPFSRSLQALIGALGEAKKGGSVIKGWVLLPEMDPSLTPQNFFQLDFRPAVQKLSEFCTDVKIYTEIWNHGFASHAPPSAPLLPLSRSNGRLIALRLDSTSSWVWRGGALAEGYIPLPPHPKAHCLREALGVQQLTDVPPLPPPPTVIRLDSPESHSELGGDQFRVWESLQRLLMQVPPPLDCELKSHASGVAFRLTQMKPRPSPLKGYSRWDIEVPPDMAEVYCKKIAERWDFRGEQEEDWEGPVTCFPLGPTWGGGDFLITRSSAARTKDKQGGGGETPSPYPSKNFSRGSPL